ncbi:MAG: transposase [Thermoplasmata archaeon]
MASGRSGLLVIDDVPLPKQGKKSPGVSKQYSGVRGSVCSEPH